MKIPSRLLLATAVLTLLEAHAAAAPAKPSFVHKGSYAPRFINATNGSVTLYDQTSNDAGIATISDGFDSGEFDSYDNQAADDFTVPSGSKWKIKEVDVTGLYWNGSGPADAVSVFFYKNRFDKKKGYDLPGREVASIPNATFSDMTGYGSFAIKLGTKGPKLSPGVYWVSVQAQMNFTGGEGEWGWENQTSSEGYKAAWRNYGCTSNCVCPTWLPEDVCFNSNQGDHMFALKGKSIAVR